MDPPIGTTVVAHAPDRPRRSDPVSAEETVGKTTRWNGVLALISAALIALSALTNLVMVNQEQSSLRPYSQRVTIDGGEANTYVTGHGDQAVILLSSYGTASAVVDFQPMIQELSEDLPVEVKRFGYGYSDPDAGELRRSTQHRLRALPMT